MDKTKHIPVLLQEIIQYLDINKKDGFIDATLGGGGHFRAVLEKLKDNGLAVGIDEDVNAIERVKVELLDKGFEEKIKTKETVSLKKKEIEVLLINDNFKNLDKYKDLFGKFKIKAIYADLGLSTDQVEDGSYGFSYQNDQALLDMRINKNSQVRASDLLNGLYKKELEKMFYELGNIAFTKKLVSEIISIRVQRPFKTVGQLRQLIQRIVPFYSRRGTNKHPEAKVFQALRIAVNQEFNNLQCFLPQAFETLASGGQLGVITFHSGEDRIVKDKFRELVELKKAEYTIKEKYLLASKEELAENIKSHSAKLRIITKN